MPEGTPFPGAGRVEPGAARPDAAPLEAASSDAAPPDAERLQVVLVHPSDGRNVGASCRAMANFGLRRLTVVSEDAIDLEAARPLAIGAESVLEGAGRVPALSEAVRASGLVVGVTRRIGEKRKGRAHAPWEVAAKIREHPDATVSLVFGNEHAGLSDEELTHCHLALSIPTSPEQPSLNLSQAVGIVCYELYSLNTRRHSDAPPARDERAVDGETLEESISAIMASLGHMGYLWHAGPRGMRTLLRDLLARAVPTYEETRRVRELFAKLAGLQRGGSPKRSRHPGR